MVAWIVYREGSPIESAYLWAVGTCVLLLVIRWVARRWQTQRMGAAQARCVQCGYIIVAGSSAICPECGSDVRKTGLITPRTPAPIALGPAYVLAALLALPVALRLADSGRKWMPVGWRYYACHLIEVRHPGQTEFAGRYAVQAVGYGRYFNKNPKAVMVYTMNVDDLTRHQNLLIDSLGSRIRYWSTTQAVVMQGEPLTTDLIARYVGQTSPVADQEVQAGVVKRIATAVHDLARGRFPTREQNIDVTLSVSYSLRDSAMLTLIGVLHVLMLAAGVLIVRSFARFRLKRARRQWQIEAGSLRLCTPSSTIT